jgi:hypothetical protein
MTLNFKTRLRSDEVGIKTSEETAAALLMPRSLVVFRREYYTDHTHGIEIDRLEEEVTSRTVNRHQLGLCEGAIVARGPRISLTFRHVPKKRKQGADFPTG